MPTKALQNELLPLALVNSNGGIQRFFDFVKAVAAAASSMSKSITASHPKCSKRHGKIALYVMSAV